MTRGRILVLAGLFIPGLLVPDLVHGPAHAQATANPGALDALNKPKPAPRPAPHPAQRPTTGPSSAPAQAASPTPVTAKPPTSGKPAGRQQLPTVPLAPPPIASLAPPTPVPVRPVPPSIIPLAADAPGETSPLPAGLRVTFGPDRSDLSTATVQALRQYAATLGASDNTTVTLMAYASGVPEDPSTPRRLSLARALAARAVLIDAGVASSRIYPRALGPATDTPPDRVDLIRFPPPRPGSEAAK